MWLLRKSYIRPRRACRIPPDITGETVAPILAGFEDRESGVGRERELELHELATSERLAQLASHEATYWI